MAEGDALVEAGAARLMVSHPSWFKRLSTVRNRNPKDAGHADALYAARTLAEAVLRGVDLAKSGEPSEWGHDSFPLWEWTVSGVAYRSSPGAVLHDASATGQIRAEGAGSVVAWLVAPGVDCPAWDAVDQGEEVTIVVRPVEG